MGRPTSQFLRDLEAAVATELREEMRIALQVGVLVALGFTARQSCERLDINIAEYRRAMALVKRAAGQMNGAGGV